MLFFTVITEIFLNNSWLFRSRKFNCTVFHIDFCIQMTVFHKYMLKACIYGTSNEYGTLIKMKSIFRMKILKNLDTELLLFAKQNHSLQQLWYFWITVDSLNLTVFHFYFRILWTEFCKPMLKWEIKKMQKNPKRMPASYWFIFSCFFNSD